MSDVVQKLWGFCHTLRHDGVDYGDYIEQITYLLFLKMADEKGIDLSAIEMTGKKGKTEVVDCSWPTLEEQAGTERRDRHPGCAARGDLARGEDEPDPLRHERQVR